jgi:hypothetical protein
MSPGARMVQKGTLEIGGQASLVVGNLCGPGFPVVPNIGMSAKYGVNDRINIGGNLYPMYLIANKTISIEPCFTGCLLEQKSNFPALITYMELPMFINFDYWDTFIFPLFGITLNYEFTRHIPYVGYELALDPDMEGKFRDLHSNIRIGISRLTERKNWISLEISLNSIGVRSYITNNSVGYPCIQFGTSFPVIKKHE